MKRVTFLILILLIGAAAPARAWCEATCLASVHETDAGDSHCPPHEQPVGSASLSAADGADCPTLDTARPIQAKLSVGLAPATLIDRAVAPPSLLVSVASQRHTRAPAHLTHVPLRI